MLSVFKEACVMNEEDYGMNKALEVAVQSGIFGIWPEIQACQEKFNMVGTKVSFFYGRYFRICFEISYFQPVVKYEQIYASPWTSSYEEELHHKKLIWKIKDWLYLNGTQKPDDVLVVLGLHIISLNSNFVPLKRRDLVEKAQLRYLKLLQKYLMFKLKDHSKAMAKFVETMRVMSYTMEASEIKARRLPF